MGQVISTLVNQKTGTQITKSVEKWFSGGKVIDKALLTTVKYGEKSPMRNLYGISSITKHSKTGTRDIVLLDGKEIHFSPDQTHVGAGFFTGKGTAKERFTQLLETLKILKLQ